MRRLLFGFFFVAACAPAPRPAPKERPAPAPATSAPPAAASAPPPVATDPLASACNGGDLARCAELGGKLHASGVREQVARAVPLLDKACKGRVASACNTLGHAYRRGGEVERDQEKSLVYFRTGCEAGEGRVLACVGLADVYIDGLGAEVDRARAIAILAPACEGDVPLACSRLGQIHTTGMGVPDDEAHHRVGAKYYDKACRLGEAGACVHLANLYRSGTGVPFDPRKARAFFQKACDAGDDFACSELEEKPKKGDDGPLP
ncbi:tetratricopeptide repeat protein [Polyangium aurulentum]|uniref:tetratricopeptide repeat protein n=1 Tax=Polyangium aurulentum TaxID=2567896 RepID=UPI0010ADC1DB|nr:tetratricopeptide repeat protein [Polyangium aurulentum]UQA58503.1 sel1 repeat family protein [Polyangium aurulentum]